MARALRALRAPNAGPTPRPGSALICGSASLRGGHRVAIGVFQESDTKRSLVTLTCHFPEMGVCDTAVTGGVMVAGDVAVAGHGMAAGDRAVTDDGVVAVAHRSSARGGV